VEPTCQPDAPDAPVRPISLLWSEIAAGDRASRPLLPLINTLYSPAVLTTARAYKKASTPSCFPLCILVK
jgi:hypothetical protein